MVQSMSDTDNFDCILQSMNKHADWPGGKGMEDLEEHPKTLSTQRQYLHKRRDISLSKDQVEEEYQPNENTV
jgi:hypothetical protein